MTKTQVEIVDVRRCAYNVLHVHTTKPDGYNFSPGQATKVFIDQFKWRNEGRYFAFAGIPDDEYLEFLVKTNQQKDVVVRKILNLKPGDKLALTPPEGELNYQGEGTFIAGGIGITPFISIFKALSQKGTLGNNKLLYSNKAEVDILYKKEFKEILGDNFVNVLEEKTDRYPQGRISKSFLKEHALSLNNYFYVCGPPGMMHALHRQLDELGVDERLIVE